MRKRTDAAMIEALAWLRDLGLEGGGTRCRPCARWRGRTSVRHANQGGQKNFSRVAVRSGRPKLHQYDLTEEPICQTRSSSNQSIKQSLKQSLKLSN